MPVMLWGNRTVVVQRNTSQIHLTWNENHTHCDCQLSRYNSLRSQDSINTNRQGSTYEGQSVTRWRTAQTPHHKDHTIMPVRVGSTVAWPGRQCCGQPTKSHVDLHPVSCDTAVDVKVSLTVGLRLILETSQLATEVSTTKADIYLKMKADESNIKADIFETNASFDDQRSRHISKESRYLYKESRYLNKESRCT